MEKVNLYQYASWLTNEIRDMQKMRDIIKTQIATENEKCGTESKLQKAWYIFMAQGGFHSGVHNGPSLEERFKLLHNALLTTHSDADENEVIKYWSKNITYDKRKCWGCNTENSQDSTDGKETTIQWRQCRRCKMAKYCSVECFGSDKEKHNSFCDKLV